MVAKQLGLVYGGGTVGLMGELARTVQDGLGPDHVLGVIPHALTPREISNELIGDTRVSGACVLAGAAVTLHWICEAAGCRAVNWEYG
jgi:predicted Rossmann-fold nucleotide-binding protein